MSEESNKKMNFFKDVLKSIKDLDKYEDYAIELPKTAFKYILKLVLIFCIIVCVFYSYKIVESMNNIYNNLMNIIPDFSYSEGRLNVNSEKELIFEQYKEVIGKIVIDTNNGIEKYEKEKDIGILFLKDKLVILSNNSVGQVSYNYKDVANQYGIANFTKEDIMNYVNNINVITIYASVFFTILIYVFIIFFIKIFLEVLLLSGLAYIVSSMSRIRLKFSSSFGIAVHAITLSLILHLIYIIVNLFTGFEINNFQFMYNTISYIYVIVAILMIKTDFIQRQIELVKLAQEQEKVREEIKQQEEKEKEQEEADKEKNKKEENSKKKKKVRIQQEQMRLHVLN